MIWLREAAALALAMFNAMAWPTLLYAVLS